MEDLSIISDAWLSEPIKDKKPLKAKVKLNVRSFD